MENASTDICEICEEVPATVALTHIVEDATHKLKLCHTCAVTAGVDLVDDSRLVKKKSVPKRRKPASDSCPTCGQRLEDFLRSTKFGCPGCYRALGDRVAALLMRIHGASAHSGKLPGGVQYKPSLDGLNRRMAEAVDRELYEEAALLRDEIDRALNSGDSEAG